MTLSVIERAMELARSGQYGEVKHIIRQLNDEGYGGVQGHLNGIQTRKRLRELCRESGGLAPMKPMGRPANV